MPLTATTTSGWTPSEKVTVPLTLSSSPARVKAALGAAAALTTGARLSVTCSLASVSSVVEALALSGLALLSVAAKVALIGPSARALRLAW